ncbi:hypothetical protein KP78_06160 [Jeotgalibacillus soli]|uniref:Uncharacterized protein n=1 Tax=Jeotgalibacillus soli TaxID=889306 RepID=A0A0C2RKA1_9BACL|nr:hypothetical protein KP78_06160 [Jeotgalibacillus soli]
MLIFIHKCQAVLIVLTKQKSGTGVVDAAAPFLLNSRIVQ